MNWIKTAINVETRGMSLTSGLVFYLGIPVFVAFLISWNNTIAINDTSLETFLGFWIGFQLITWTSYIPSTLLAHWFLQSWQPKMIWVLLAGQAIALVLFTWPIRAYLNWGFGNGRMAPFQYSNVTVGFSTDYLLELFYGILPAAMVWFSTNLFYRAVLNVPRYHYGNWDPVDRKLDGEKQHAAPALLRRLPDPIKGDIMALKAEDHYVRVFTDKGDSLIHYRFKDAIADTSALNGIQTHRSYWVEQSAIADLENSGQATYITLTTGMKIPISRTYLNDVKRFVAQLSD